MTTTDCPICLCPITSEPWGVVSPCGHPYHRECWDQVAANHAASGTGGGRGRNKHAPCSICKGGAKLFVPVFLDLDNDAVGTGGGRDGGACVECKEDDGIINLDGDEKQRDALEKLVDEWDDLWRELETLCGKCRGERVDGNESDGNSVVDMTDRSDQVVADICATIDLTQTSPRQLTQQVQTQSSTQHEQSLEMQMQQFEEKRGRIPKIMQQLKRLHSQILQSQQFASQSPSTSNKRMQRLKTKVTTLQSTNSELASQNKTLQSTNEKLSARLDDMKDKISERTVEAERAKRRYETLSSDFESIESSYQRYMSQSKEEKTMLQQRITKLMAEFKKLSDEAGLEEMRGMEEIRRKYTRMSQDVHDVKAKNAQLEKECLRKERKWMVRVGEEKERCEGLKIQLKRLKARANRAESIMGHTENNDRSMGRNMTAEDRAGEGGGFESSSASDRNAKVPVDRESAVALSRTALTTANIFPGAQQRSNAQDAFRVKSAAAAPHVKSASTEINDNIGKRSLNKAMDALDRASAAARKMHRNAHQRSNMHADMPSTTEIFGNIQKKSSNKAMDALDRASARKFSAKPKRPHPRQIQQWQPPQPHTSHGVEEDTMASDDGTDGVQLMMRTGPSSKKRRHGSSSGITSSNKDGLISGRKSDGGYDGKEASATACLESPSYKPPRKLVSVSYSPRQKRNITSFFKPV